MRYPLPWFPLSDDHIQCSCRTIRGCRPYRSSLSRCRLGRSGSRGFVGRLLRLRLISRGLAPRVHSFRDRCRYRYIWPSQTNPVSSSRSSERQKLPAFHTHPMSGLEVLCRLWLAYWVENQFTIHLD